MPDPNESFAAAVLDAKRLLRLSRVGALATLDGGSPLATLVGVASDWDGSPLFLTSELSRHTRNLLADPRASLLLTSEGGRGDPLNHPRLTLVGRVKLYAGFADFALRRLEIETVHFNGGFGRADALTAADILSPAEGLEALIAAEDALIAEVDALDEALLSRLAGADSGRRIWRAAGLDAEGLELSAGTLAARVQFAAPAREPETWRARLRAHIEG